MVDVRVERDSGGLGGRSVEDAVTSVEERGMRMEYTTRERVWWFGPQNHRWTIFGFGPHNPGGGSEEARGGITEVASR